MQLALCAPGAGQTGGVGKETSGAQLCTSPRVGRQLLANVGWLRRLRDECRCSRGGERRFQLLKMEKEYFFCFFFSSQDLYLNISFLKASEAVTGYSGIRGGEENALRALSWIIISQLSNYPYTSCSALIPHQYLIPLVSPLCNSHGGIFQHITFFRIE